MWTCSMKVICKQYVTLRLNQIERDLIDLHLMKSIFVGLQTCLVKNLDQQKAAWLSELFATQVVLKRHFNNMA